MSRSRKIAFAVMLLLLLCVATSFYGLASLIKISGPFNRSEAYNRIAGISIYHPEAASAYNDLNTTYYYIETHDQVRTETYLVNAKSTVIAQMLTYTLFKGGPPKLKKPIAVTWANGSGYICETPTGVSNRTPFPESRYQSCIYWMDAEHNHHLLFSIWDVAETVALVNSLVKVTKS